MTLWGQWLPYSFVPGSIKSWRGGSFRVTPLLIILNSRQLSLCFNLIVLSGNNVLQGDRHLTSKTVSSPSIVAIVWACSQLTVLNVYQQSTFPNSNRLSQHLHIWALQCSVPCNRSFVSLAVPRRWLAAIQRMDCLSHSSVLLCLQSGVHNGV